MGAQVGSRPQRAGPAARQLRVMVNTASTFKGGGVQVARSLIEEWAASGEHRFLVAMSSAVARLIDPSLGSERLQLHALDYRPAERVLGVRDPAEDLRRWEAAFRPDVVITTSGPAYWRPRAPHLMGFNLPHYLYPESPFFSRLVGRRERATWWLKGRLLRHYSHRDADAYVVQTDDINERLRRWLGTDRVHTIANTVSRHFQDRRAAPATDSDTLDVLVLSAAYRHKNLELIDDIIAILRAQNRHDIRFITTLPTDALARIVRPAHRPWVLNVGPQRPEECPALYERADVLFLPSLLECFSANYVEAMTMGRPIVTTDLGFARTVCHDAALYFRPMDPTDALRQLDRLGKDAQLRRGLTERGQAQVQRFGTAAARAKSFLELAGTLVT